MGYLDLTISEIHQLLVDKKVTPLELTLEALARAKNNTDNAFEIILEKKAIAFAKKLKEPEPDNYLWGIPYTLKDNLATKDIQTTGGSNMLVGYKPTYDSAVYEILKKKKAILIGKTTLDELGLGGTGTTGHLGRTTNPLDPSKTHLVGGSSCGSAVSVAANIVPFSIGTDTGDSVRKPASYTGLFGYKPTWGLVSRRGLFSFCPSLDHVGFFTRSALDSAILLNALSQFDKRDGTSYKGKRPDYVNSLKTESCKRIAIIKEVVDSIPDSNVLHHFNRLVKQLENRGYICDTVSVNPELLRAVYPSYIVLSSAEATSNNACLDGLRYGPRPSNADSYADMIMAARTEGFGEMIKRRFVLGSISLLRENQEETFIRSKKVRRLIVEAMEDIFDSYAYILLPAAPSSAPKYNESTADKLSPAYLIADNHLAIGNFGGFPSITLPLGSNDKLPFGVNITGEVFDDDEVLKLAFEIENLGGER